VTASPDPTRYARYFEGELAAGMRQRIGVWYESGMAETYLYACLVEAFEDKAKSGIVIYDSRVDWKLKADLIVVANGIAVTVSAFVGEKADRAGIELNRDYIEREGKKNTMESSQWDNIELKKMLHFQISRTPENTQEVNGVRLFTLSSINQLITEICNATGAIPYHFPDQELALYT